MSLTTLNAGLCSLTRQPHFAAVYPKRIIKIISCALSIDPAKSLSAVHLLHITELQRARTKRLEACSSVVNNTMSQLIDKAITTIIEVAQQETFMRLNLEKLMMANLMQMWLLLRQLPLLMMNI